MGRMENDAETFVRGHADRDADEKERRDEKSPPSRCSREHEEDAEDKASDDMANARVANKEDPRLVTITDRPANKVWMGLAAEVGFNHVSDQRQGGWVGGMLEGVQDSGTCSVGQIQFARGVRSQIMADDPIDFCSERLDCD